MNYHDKHGKPISHEQWSKHMQDWNYCAVKQQRTPGRRFFVSTVWIGIEGQMFETIVFGDRSDAIIQRYPSLAEASLGHRKLYNKYAKKDNLKIDDFIKKTSPA